MASGAPDPYLILGVTPGASDEQLRTAYRRLVQLHHPDHNNGSRESALRFAEVQEAYAHVKLLRRQAAADQAATNPGTTSPGAGPGSDPDVEARLAAMERELRAAREQRERAAHAAAREAARVDAEAARARAAARRTRRTGEGEEGRASDEELGYFSTDDSFTKILDDFAGEVSARFAEAHPEQSGQSGPGPRPGQRKPRSLADWIDELGSRLAGEHRSEDKE